MAARGIEFNQRLRQAVRAFWRSRQLAASRPETAGKKDQGNRAAVTAGKNLDGFREMIVDVVRRFGPPEIEVHRDKSLVVLPGFFRPSKQWDLLVLCRGRLLAVLELKSLCGPSFGNNANNRCEEAIGSGYDFRKAQAEGLFGRGAAPFLGYFILVEGDSRTNQPVKVHSPHFPGDSIFQSSSYQDRMRILCERLVEQQVYSCASVLVAPQDAKSGHSFDLSKHTGFHYFLSRLAGHLAGECDSLDTPRVRDEPLPSSGLSLLDGAWFASGEDAEEA
jgi:hypothetical protein